MRTEDDVGEHRIGIDLMNAATGSSSAEEILNNMGEAFALIDRDFCLLDLNRAAQELDQRPRHELVGQPIWVITPDLEDSEFGDTLRRVMQTRELVTAEHKQTWPDGRTVWVEARLVPVKAGLAVFYRNIGERKRAEAALRESEELKRKILQSSTDCIKVLTLDGRLEFMSEGGLAVMEIDDFNPLSGELWINFWPTTEQEKVRHAVTEAAAGRATRFRGQAPTAKGNIRWWDVAVSPVEGADGRPDRILSISRDISAAHAAETELADTTRRLNAILSNTTMAVFLMDDHQQCVFANDAAEELTGYSFAEMQGRPLHDIVHHKRPDGSHYPLEDCPIDRAFPERAQTQGEEVFVAPDGSFYPVAFTASPIHDDHGTPIGTIIEVRPIAEEQEQRRTLETLNQIGQTLAAEVDLERIVQMVTDAGVKLTGARFGAFFHNVLAEDGEKYLLYTLSGAERSDFEGFGMPRATNVFAPTFLGGAVIRSDDILVDSRYGKSAPHYGMPKGHLPVRSYLAVPVQSRSGEVIGGLFFGHPEPGQFRKNHEDLLVGIAAHAAIAVDNARLYNELRSLNGTLEERIQSALKERADVEEALRQAQKMEAVGQLTGGIAHDFNNLLAGILGSLDVIERRLAQGRTGGIDRFMAGAQTSAKRAAALTQRLLAFSRRQTLDPKPTHVNRLIVDMEDLIRRTVGPSIVVEVVGSAGLWITKVDPSQLENALLNLSINARDAMPTGGRITIETANKWLDARASAERDLTPGQYISICVTDTGTGIPKNIVDRVFDPFFTTKPTGQGTGLGLSMIHGFLRQSGGQVRVYTEEGKGTTMCLYLPRYVGALEYELVEQTGGSIQEHGAGEIVLVIDDEPTVRMLVVEVLEEAGYTAIEAEDGPSGLKILMTDARIDLLITDVGLPGGMNGRQVADAAREYRPDLKVLFITGYAENAAVGNGHLDPGMEVMAKPFAIVDLANKIAEMIEQ